MTKIAIALLLAIPAASQAQTVTYSLSKAGKLESCEKALNACDKAIEAADKAIKAKDATLEVKEAQIEELARRNAELEASRDSLWRNPLVWFFAGALVGGLSYGTLQAIQ